MTISILVVDDSLADQRIVSTHFNKAGGDYDLEFASTGQEAITFLESETPDVVLTDMHMPEMNGLELVRYVRGHRPQLPVILMTGKGSEELAVQALSAGAASYVPKRNLAKELVRIVEDVVAVAGARREQQSVVGWMARQEFHFVFGSEFRSVEALIGFLQEQMRQMGQTDETALLHVGMALQESMANAIEHGNLELSSDLRHDDGGDDYREIVRRRLSEPPYCDRHVLVTARVNRARSTFIIRDQGLGFDPSTLPDPTDPANLDLPSGRGLLLIRTFMDEVSFSHSGNEITMVKHARQFDLDDDEVDARDASRLLDFTVEGNAVVIVPRSDLRELDHMQIEEEIRAILAVIERGEANNVIVDFDRTNYFGSTAIGMFVRLTKRAKSQGGQFVVCNLSDVESEILRTAALDKIWLLSDTREDALRAVEE